MTVANGITTRIHNDPSGAEFIVATLRDTYNRRQQEYARYRKIVPHGDEGTKDTLFWEFAKLLFNLFVDNNDTFDLLALHVTVSTASIPFLKQANVILRS